MRSGILFSTLVCLTIQGCGDQASSRQQTDQTRIFDTQRDALDKAKSVQDTVLRADSQRRDREKDGD